jgi:hypothetical protein
VSSQVGSLGSGSCCLACRALCSAQQLTMSLGRVLGRWSSACGKPWGLQIRSCCSIRKEESFSVWAGWWISCRNWKVKWTQGSKMLLPFSIGFSSVLALVHAGDRIELRSLKWWRMMICINFICDRSLTGMKERLAVLSFFLLHTGFKSGLSHINQNSPSVNNLWPCDPRRCSYCISRIVASMPPHVWRNHQTGFTQQLNFIGICSEL